MPSAQIIAIGTELLLGVTQDTNTSFIAHTLNQYGVDIFKTAIIGDNEERIAREIQTSLEQADIIITTGGLGPTVDDPTRQAVARAFGVELDYHPELWEQIQARFKGYGRQPSENNKRQAYLPRGAQAIENPVGTAPAFAFRQTGRIVISLPGVPSEMKTLLLEHVLPLLRRQYDLAGTTLSRTLHTAGMGESNVDELVAEFETLSNPTVGLAAHPGQVDIRITAKAASSELARRLIEPVESQIKKLLGIKIYGVDEDTLPDVVVRLAEARDLRLDIFYAPQLQAEADELAGLACFQACRPIPENAGGVLTPDLLYNDTNTHNYLLLFTRLEDSRQVIDVQIHLNGKNYQESRKFGGHPALYPLWVKNHILSMVRETIIKEKGDL
jgi:nicotinamide-nucleotide amidase